jgi:hypothetical protein
MRNQLTFSLLINVRRIKNIATADQNSDAQTARPFAWTGKLSEMILSKLRFHPATPSGWIFSRRSLSLTTMCPVARLKISGWAYPDTPHVWVLFG